MSQSRLISTLKIELIFVFILVLLLALAGTAAAADVVEIRSSVLHYQNDVTHDSSTGLTTGNLDSWLLDSESWVSFCYNLDSDKSTEQFYISPIGNSKINIKYTTAPVFQEYDYEWKDDGTNSSGYAMIGFFTEPYVALGPRNLNNKSVLSSDVDATQIAKLVIDTDEEYVLKKGETLELGSKYSLLLDQVDGTKAYISLMHDGKAVKYTIVVPSSNGTWICDHTVFSESKQVMRLHVKSLSNETSNESIEIDGIWLVDFLNPLQVKPDVNYNRFSAFDINNEGLTYFAENLLLSKDTDFYIGRGILIKTEENFNAGTTVHESAADDDKFYFFKYNESEYYEIRSSVYNWDGTIDGLNSATSVGTGHLTYENFVAFYYDLDSDTQTETLRFSSSSGNIGAGQMVYVTKPAKISYEHGGWNQNYYVMGIFGETYVPFNFVNDDGSLKNTPLKSEKMAKLVIDDDTRYALKVGATLELGNGYVLIADRVSPDGTDAFLKFLKDGREVNSILITDGGNDWILKQTVLGENDVQVFRVHVKDIFWGNDAGLVEIQGLWLMDYINAKEIKSGDKLGVMEFQSGGDSLTLVNDAVFTITPGMDKHIVNNMYLRSSDEPAKRAYFYVVPPPAHYVTPKGFTDQIESVSMMYASNNTLAFGQEKTSGFDSVMTFSPAAVSSWASNEDYYFLAQVKSGYTFDGNDFAADSSNLGRTSSFDLTHGSVSKTLTVVKDEMVYGVVWNDANQNGIHEITESPLSGVTVQLYNGTLGSGNLQKTVVSEADGSYRFLGIAADDYYIEITLPSGYSVSSAGADQSIDSALRSELFNVKAREHVEKNVGLFLLKTSSSGSGFGSAVISDGTPATLSPNEIVPVETPTETPKETQENTQDPIVSPPSPSGPVSGPPTTNWVWPAVIFFVLVIGGAAVILFYKMKK